MTRRLSQARKLSESLRRVEMLGERADYRRRRWEESERELVAAIAVAVSDGATAEQLTAAGIELEEAHVA